MNFKQYAFPFFAFLFLAIGAISEYTSFLSPEIDQHRDVLEADLHQKESEIYQVAERKDQLLRIFQYKNELQRSIKPTDLEWLEELSQKSYTFHIYQNDSLIFWSNSRAYLDTLQRKRFQQASQFVQLREGYYEIIRYPLELDRVNYYELIGLIPFKYEYNLDSPYLIDHFPADHNIPKSIQINNELATAPLTIKTIKGEQLCQISSSTFTRDKRSSYWLFFIYLSGLFFLSITVHRFALKLAKERSILLGTSFILLFITVIATLGHWTNFTHKFSALKVFQETPETFLLGNSLGDFLMTLLLILWFVIFINGQVKYIVYKDSSLTQRSFVAFFCSFAIVFVIASVASMLKGLIFYSNVSFNFDNIFSLQSNSLFAIVGVVVLLISLFIISHMMMTLTHKCKLSAKNRFTSYFIAILCVIPFYYLYDLNIYMIAILAFLTIFLVGLDIFVGNKNEKNLTSIVIWMVLLAGFASVLLFTYNFQKEAIDRQKFVTALANPADTIAEEKIIEFEENLLNNVQIKDLLINGYSQEDARNFFETVDQYYYSSNYLYSNYKYTPYFVNANLESFGEEEQYNLSLDLQVATERKKSKNNNRLYLTNYATQDDVYFLKIPFYPNGNIEEDQYWWILEFAHNQRKESQIDKELLDEKSYKNLEGLEKYEYAIYKKGQLTNATSNLFAKKIDYDQLNVAAEKIAYDAIAANVLTTTYKDGDKAVFLEKPASNKFKTISIFSFIFALLIFSIIFMSLVNLSIGFFPEPLVLSSNHQPTLKGKIQIWIILLIVISFVLIGVLTVVYFSNSNENYHEERLARKTESVIKAIDRELNNVIIRLSEDIKMPKENVLKKLDLKAIANIHRMDINIFNNAGTLVHSSDKDIFEKRILSPKMNPIVYDQLAPFESNRHIQVQEQIGSLDYKTSYLPLRAILQGREQTLGYLGLPYYSKASSLREDVTVFMGTLLNVYIFLLIIASVIAAAVAKQVTKPIEKIGDKLKEFKLGGRNQPIEWHSNDEIGVLIEAYNRMALKIQEGADTLAQNEREGAWREMAKQVAHEIKNPLTPMKLSIQYLKHAYRSNPDNAKNMLERVSNTLIEQIDNLSQIASEFGNFAKMPRAENQRILLNRLVESVYDLFKEHREVHSVLELPDELYYVYADKNHLIRVFNNIIKNAIQAIPDGRQGEILVRMYTEMNKIMVEIKDNGSGISDEMKEKVFVPNFTTKNSGTGLGLAISKNIIESVNGQIYFETELGKGTSFFIKLPIIEVKDSDEIDI